MRVRKCSSESHQLMINNICLDGTTKDPNSQNDLEKEEQTWRYYAPRFQTILQSYGNQNYMVMAQKQAHRSMEQNREPRNKPTLTW